MLPFCNTIGTVAQENPFSITLAFPHLDIPEFQRALELARQSSGFRQTGDGARLTLETLHDRAVLGVA